MTHLSGTQRTHNIPHAGRLSLLAATCLAACLSACVSDDDATLSASARFGDSTVAKTQAAVERIDHQVVNLLSVQHDTDTPGASIAAYEK